MYLNEVFDYLGFPGYHSRCWQLLFGGEGESRTLKQRVKNTYTLIDKGGWGWGCDAGSPAQSVPTPIADSSSRVIQVFWQNCGSTIPYPAFRFSCWRAARALCKWDQLRGLDCRSERRGAEGSSKVTGLVERGISCPKKMHWAPLQQCFAADTWRALYVSEWRSYSVCAVVVWSARRYGDRFRDAPDFVSIKDTDEDWLF